MKSLILNGLLILLKNNGIDIVIKKNPIKKDAYMQIIFPNGVKTFSITFSKKFHNVKKISLHELGG